MDPAGRPLYARGPNGDFLDRRTYVCALTGGLLAAPLAAGAQPAGKVLRIDSTT
jgi:hypothetical protein